ncbi:hypothetical protein [Polaribacter sp. R77954]|uniref:hypothetical protein n=1 Tax=Polaribacter sp. R77954 TaxID=3093870 RepID=UPI0037CBAD42
MKNYKDLFWGCFLFLTAIILLVSCSSAMKIIDSKKNKHISGLSNGKNYIDYTIHIEIETGFNFKSILLNNDKITEHLYIKNLATGLTSTKINSEIKKGAYLFGFRVLNTTSFNADETITFKYMKDNREHQLIKKVLKEDKIITNR